MSRIEHRTPRSGRQSLFFQDLATPVSSRRSGGKFSTPGQAAAVSALWRENFSNSDLPPPPAFTLEDRSDFSPETGIPDYPASPGVNSDPRTPIHKEFSTPKSKSEASTSYASILNQRSPLSSSNWWSPTTKSGEHDDKGKGSPVEGVVNPGALLILPPKREVARPEMKKNDVPFGNLNEEEWVTIYGFSPADTNLVLREFEKCGVILKHVAGPREANWIHILYQNRADAEKALKKNGMQINGVLIIGVKIVDTIERQKLNERVNNKQGFMPKTPSSSSSSSYYLQNGSSSTRQSGGTVASPAKSIVSKVMDLMFGV